MTRLYSRGYTLVELLLTVLVLLAGLLLTALFFGWLFGR